MHDYNHNYFQNVIIQMRKWCFNWSLLYFFIYG